MRTTASANWLWLTFAVIAADRLTKYAVESKTVVGFRHVLIPQFAALVHSRNSGVAFGLLGDSGNRWFPALLLVISAAVVLMLGWLLLTERVPSGLSAAGCALLAGGAAGNLLDRMLHGAVTDFVELHAGTFYWPAFNLADSAITIGAVLLAIEMFRSSGQTSSDTRHPSTQE
jgi:signal peptidase II